MIMEIKELISEIRQARGNRNRSASTAQIFALVKKIKKSDLDPRLVVEALLADKSDNALKLALSLIPTNNSDYTKEMSEVVLLADHENWEVREYAADALASILEGHFEDAEAYLNELRTSGSENGRRAIVVALKYLGKARQLERGDAIVRLLSEFMDDSSAYVQKNLGPFAIGDGLIEYYPKAVVAMLKKKSRSQSHIARWNVAAVFTAAVGTNFFDALHAELLRLLHDPDTRVRNTAMKAVKTVAKRHPSSRPQILAAVKNTTVAGVHSAKAIDDVLEVCK
jgi:HEAT repeat protein